MSTESAVLYQALAGVDHGLGFDLLGDPVFADLVIARIVEPGSMLDCGRVLKDLGREPASYSTMRRCLARAGQEGKYRAQVAQTCFQHASTRGDLTLCLYDVTTLFYDLSRAIWLSDQCAPGSLARFGQRCSLKRLREVIHMLAKGPGTLEAGFAWTRWGWSRRFRPCQARF